MGRERFDLLDAEQRTGRVQDQRKRRIFDEAKTERAFVESSRASGVSGGEESNERHVGKSHELLFAQLASERSFDVVKGLDADATQDAFANAGAPSPPLEDDGDRDGDRDRVMHCSAVDVPDPLGAPLEREERPGIEREAETVIYTTWPAVSGWESRTV